MSSYGTIPRTLGVKPVPRIRSSYKDTTMKKLTFKQRIINWLKDDDDAVYSVDRSIESGIDSNGIRFHLYKASGGYVVETRFYDENTDRNKNKLYVITDEKELGDELAKIITMESLR